VMVPQDAVQTIGDRTVVFVRTATGFKATTCRSAAAAAGWSRSSPASRPGPDRHHQRFPEG
jgi:hypothetical protein